MFLVFVLEKNNIDAQVKFLIWILTSQKIKVACPLKSVTSEIKTLWHEILLCKFPKRWVELGFLTTGPTFCCIFVAPTHTSMAKRTTFLFFLAAASSNTANIHKNKDDFGFVSLDEWVDMKWQVCYPRHPYLPRSPRLPLALSNAAGRNVPSPGYLNQSLPAVTISAISSSLEWLIHFLYYP